MPEIPRLKDAARCARLVDAAIADMRLDLHGLVVLTEAATGAYVLTPLIAARAGARVLALAADSRYATASTAAAALMAEAADWGLADRITTLEDRYDPRIATADIVTNLGPLRPLDRPMLARLGPSAVIPLMWEPWELRSEELDVAACRTLGIPVVGTNEQHPRLGIFRYVGMVALKLAFELGLEVCDSAVVVLGGGMFGESVETAFARAGARVASLRPSEGQHLGDAAAREALREADLLVMVEHVCRDLLVGPGGQCTAADLRALNPSLVVAHVAGGLDAEEAMQAGLRVHPYPPAAPGHMTVATDYVGPRPVVDLHAAGLRVGQGMAVARSEGLAGRAAERRTVALTDLAMLLDGTKGEAV